MKGLIEFIAKSLVEHPDQVEVREYGNGDHIRLELSVAMAILHRQRGGIIQQVYCRFAPGPIEQAVTLALDHTKGPGGKCGCRTECSNLSRGNPERFLHRIFHILGRGTHPAGKAHEIGLTLKQQSID